MNVIFDFNSNWYILLFAFLAAWALLLVVRRKWLVKHEVKQQVFLSFRRHDFTGAHGVLCRIDGTMELYTWELANYSYGLPDFVAILFGYQLLRSIESLFPHRPVM